MEVHRRRSGRGGPGGGNQWSLPLVMRGTSYRLGRHVFDRCDDGLNMHIPADGGPLAPQASDDSIDRARVFFPRHFEGEPPEPRVGCHSWLLDGQWAAYLPPSSNIVRFQRRFQIEPNENELADQVLLGYAFDMEWDRPEVPREILDALPQRTTLQRAYVSHLRSGAHWYNRSGWFSLSE
jgi:hypothetical protein